jgi:flagellar basal-body rod modification protein FlgD
MSIINTNSSTTPATSSISAAAAAQSMTSGAKSANSSLGQSDFLKLMTAQMTHQDPTAPMTNGDFLSQIAQFGTVDGIQGLQTSFNGFANSMGSNQSLQATNLIGKTVSTATNQGALAAGGTLKGSVDLANSSSKVSVQIINPSNGSVVSKMDLGSQAAGSVPFSWNGKDSNGVAASPGIYQVKVNAMVNGANTALTTTNIQSQVTSVSMGAQGVQVNLAGGLSSVNLSQVTQIS